MTNSPHSVVVSNNLPTLSTVKNLPSFFPAVGLTLAAIHGQIFKAENRLNSRGEKILGNGLAASGAIIRRGRKVLIDVDRYGAWLSGIDRIAASRKCEV